MKKILKSLLFAAVVALGVGFVSCSDDRDDLNTVLVLDRALTPQNFSATVLDTGCDARFSWDVRKDVAAYVLSIYNNELCEGEALWTGEVTGDQVPYTLKGVLEAEQTYYAALYAVSADERVKSSNRVISEAIETYAIMTSLDPRVEERASSSITLAWTADDFLTHIKVVPTGATEGTEYEVTDADLQAAKATVEGLTPSTGYTLTLYYNSAARGTVEAWTRPDETGATRVTNSAELQQALVDGATKIAVAYSEEPYTLEFAAGVTNPLPTWNQALTIYGESTPEGLQPTIIGFTMGMNPGAAEYAVTISDLKLNGNGAGYVVNVPSNAVTHISSLVIKNCEIFNYAKNIATCSDGGAELHVSGEILFDGLTAYNINPEGTGGGDTIDFRVGTYNNLTLRNSTIYNGGRTFFYLDKNISDFTGNIVIENNTLSNVNMKTNRQGMFCVRLVDVLKGAFEVKNNLILNILGEGQDLTKFHLVGNYDGCVTPTFANNYYYNFSNNDDNSFFTSPNAAPEMSEAVALGGGGKVLKDDPCQKSLKGQFWIENGDVITNSVGDPRWWTAVAPVVPEQTELNPLTAAYVWSFANSDLFEETSITRTRIISNLQFIVDSEENPMSISKEGQLLFAKASKVLATGVPEDQAVAFMTAIPGTLIVDVAEGAYNSHLEAIVGDQRRTMTADGSVHMTSFEGINEPTVVYIVACGDDAVINSIEWSEDILIEGPFTLDTPAPTASAADLMTKGGVDQVISWKAIENAASYEVVFNGKTSEVTEPEFVITASTIAGLEEGDYTVDVKALPAPTSLNFLASGVGSVSFHVTKTPENIDYYTWDFTDETIYASATLSANTDYLSAPGSRALTIMAASGKEVTIEGGNRIKMGGKSTLSEGIPTERAFKFVAQNKGTLKITHCSASSSGTGRNTIVLVDGVEVGRSEALLTSGEGKANPVTFLLDDVKAGQTIYIYCDASINYYGIAWEEEKPQATAKEERTMTLTNETVKAVCADIPGNKQGTIDLVGFNTWQMDGVSFNSRLACAKSSDIPVLYLYKQATTDSYLESSELGEIQSIEITFISGAFKAASKLSMTCDGAAVDCAADSDNLKLTYTFPAGNSGQFKLQTIGDDLKIESMVINYLK